MDQRPAQPPPKSAADLLAQCDFARLRPERARQIARELETADEELRQTEAADAE